MNTLTLLLLLGPLLPAISSSTLHGKLFLRGFNSSSTQYGNFSSKDVKFSNLSSEDVKSSNVTYANMQLATTNGQLAPVAFRSLPKNGEYLLTMNTTLANMLGSSANDRTCPQPNLFVAGGVTLCEGSPCPVQLGKMLARVASSLNEFNQSWLYVSTISPNLEGGNLKSRHLGSRNDGNAFDDAWMDIEQYSLQTSLYSILDTLPSEVRLAKLQTISKFWLLEGLAHYKQFDAPLASNQIAISDYTCSGQLTATSSACPTWSATYTSPSTTVSTYLPPCGHTLCSPAAVNTLVSYTGPLCATLAPWEGCECAPTVPDARANYLQDFSAYDAEFSGFAKAFSEMKAPVTCSQGLLTTFGTTQTICSCGKMIYGTKTGPSVCAYTMSLDLPTPLPTNCVPSVFTTTFPTTTTLAHTQILNQVTSTTSSCACADSTTVPAASWLLASFTTTGCLTGQTIPTPTVTPVPYPYGTQSIFPAAWAMTAYAGTTCAADQFTYPNSGAQALWGTTMYQACQTLQQPAYYGLQVSQSIDRHESSLCIQNFAAPGCKLEDRINVVCGPGACCMGPEYWRRTEYDRGRPIATRQGSLVAWNVVPKSQVKLPQTGWCTPPHR